MGTTGLSGYVYDFSVEYDAIPVDDIKDIHKYLMKKNNIVQMNIFRFFQKAFFIGLTILSDFTKTNSLLNAIPLICILMKNQECKTRPQIVNVDSNNPIFYPFSINLIKCRGNCNNINNPYAKIYALNLST